MLDRLPLPATRIARNLHLLENTWRKLVLLDLHTMPITRMTGIHLSILTSTALALLTNHLFLQLELGGMPIVEILQWNTHSNFHVRTSSLAAAMSEMSASAEETREQVEGVVVVSSTALLSLLEAFVSVLVVDLAGFGVREGFIRFCYLDEFLLGGGIPTAGLLVRALIWRHWSHTGSYRGGIFCSGFGRLF
jgi:hypothetical protein